MNHYVQGNVFQIPFEDGYFDLVFTAGVLIHIALHDLPAAMDEILRVSRRYVMAAEYYSSSECAIHYRGHDNLLWKRDFLKHYRDRFSDLKLVKSGEFTRDEMNWWLLDKGAGGRYENCGNYPDWNR